MVIIGHIFYLLGLFLFLMSFSKTINYTRYVDIKEWMIAFKKVTEKDPKSDDFKDDEESLINSFITISIIEILWFIIGLLSNSWIIFIGLLILHTINVTISKFTPNIVQKVFGFSIGLIKTVIILILVINHFHLHIDLIGYLSSLTS